MNTKDINFLNKIKESCTICSGQGYSIIEKDANLLFEDCKCVKTILYKGNLLTSGIPARYIDWDISKLTDEFKADNKEAYDYIINYITNITQNIEDGISFWMSSPPGLAKSSISSYIIKYAITNGYKGCYCTMAKLVSQKFKNNIDDIDEENFITNIVDKADIIVIEEFEKVYLKDEDSFLNHMYYEIISDFYDAKKAVILTSNKTKKVVCKTLPSYIVDRLETIDYIPICGKSGRIK